ncbi:MAG: TIGR01777 family oxidoreductase [Paludibacteraceae bacterium]
MNILIAGGTGFLGTYIKKRFEENNHGVRVVSRAAGDVSWIEKELTDALEKTDVLINLAGKSIDCRFTNKNKEQILKSRIETTELLNNAIAKCKNPPDVWINASATGIYEHTFDEKLNEYFDRFADDFLGEVVKNWENVFFSSYHMRTRKVALRTAVVLGKSGGVYPLLNRLSKFGAGGKQGNGRQMFSWIYIEDYFRILNVIVENKDIIGVINASAPTPVSNADLMKAFRKVNKTLIALPSPAILLNVGSYFLNFHPGLIFDSTNVVSKKLELLNFKFDAENIEIILQKLNDNNDK